MSARLERFVRDLEAKAQKLETPERPTEQGRDAEHTVVQFYNVETGEVLPERRRPVTPAPEPEPRPAERVIYLLPDNGRDDYHSEE